MRVTNLATEVSTETADINVAFWNLQNLFDLQSSSLATELGYTPLNGWNRQCFDARINHLSEVIRLMFDGRGPDLLGVCEIENSRVAGALLEALERTDYALAHVETVGISGLDTSLIYSTKLFDIDESQTRGHLVHLQYPTRDIFEVHLKVRTNNADLVVFVNHWPSVRPGGLDAEPFRLTVAAHCRQLVDQLLKLSRPQYLHLPDTELSAHELNHTWNRNVLLMGDFNDEPWSRSISEVLAAVYSTGALEDAVRTVRGTLPSYKSYASRTAWLHNPMWSLLAEPDLGTAGSVQPGRPTRIVDQFLLSRGLCLGLNGLETVRTSTGIPAVDVFRPDVMCTRRNRPREFKLESKSGYSDHFPITMSLRAVDNSNQEG